MVQGANLSVVVVRCTEQLSLLLWQIAMWSKCYFNVNSMRSCICCSSTKGTDDSQFRWEAWTRVQNNVAIISSVRGAKVIDVIGQMKLFCIWDVLALASPICAQHTLGSIHPLRPSNKWVTYFCQLSPLALSLSNGFALTSIKSEVRHWQTGIGVCVCALLPALLWLTWTHS